MPDPYRFLIIGYLVTIAVETPILLMGLSKRHLLKHRFFAGIWLTACTYPIVVLVLPALFDFYEHRERYFAYLLVAEIFAPLAECLLFWVVFDRKKPGAALATFQDMVAIVLANLASFGTGLLMEHYQAWQHLGIGS